MLSLARARSAHALSGAAHRRAASSIAIKYAHAAFNAALAQSPQTLQKVNADLAAIAQSLSTTPTVAEFIHNPTLSAADRHKGLETLFSTKKDADKITRNLLDVMSENGRLGEFDGVFEEFKVLLSKHRGELEVIVTSDKPIPGDLMKRLETSLKASQAAQKSKSLKVTNKVNPAILGGLIVEFGEKTIDLSVSSRVSKLNALLTESV